MLRTELSEMIALAEQLAAAGEPAVLATLFSAQGSTYRPLGSMMLSGPGTRYLAGGVSGGCLEEYIARRGRSLIEQRAATMLTFATDPDGEQGGVPSLGCGGSIEVLVERFTSQHLTFLQRFESALHADVPSTVACLLDTAQLPSISVSRTWFDGDRESGDAADPQLLPLRRRAIQQHRSQNGACGRTSRALVHYVPPMTRLVIIGAGNDARPVSTLAQSLGWHVTVADCHARRATQLRFPDADQVVVAEVWQNALSQITFTNRTATVLMTHSLADDMELLPLLSRLPSGYVGVLGPAHRLGWLQKRIEDAGTASSTFIAGIRGPIGFDLGERSAAGIAVAIVSEILAELNARHPAQRSRAIPEVPAELQRESMVAHA